MLASTAAALAAPYAEHFFTGTPIVEPDQLRNQSNVLAAAGMRSGLDCWLVVTPAHAGEVGLELRLPPPALLCDGRRCVGSDAPVALGRLLHGGA